MDLSLRQLQVIVAVAEGRSFTAAGEQLGLSQQSVSALVRSAEDRLGIRLFERTTRSVEPSPECNALLPDVRYGLSLIATALGRARNSGLAERPLVIGVSPAVAYGELKHLIAALENRALPDPEIREVWADELLAGVREGRFDAGIGIELPDIPGLEVTPWKRQRVDLLVCESHHFAKLARVPVARLGETTLAVPGESTNPALRDRILETLHRVGAHPRLTEAPRVAGPAPIDVERGQAATVWLSGMDERYLPAGLVRLRLCEPDTWVTTSLVTSRRPSETVPRSLDVLRKAIGDTSRLSPDRDS